MDATAAPYGSWASPLSAEAVGAARVHLGDLRSAGRTLYWTQSVPSAGGISAVFARYDDTPAKMVTPQGVNVRTRVHEYGGAPYAVLDDIIYYSQFADQRLYALSAGEAPKALTPSGYRFADCTAANDRAGPASLICVREDHTTSGNVRNAVVRLPLAGDDARDGGGGGGGGEGEGEGEVLYGESDFVASPRISPDGHQLAFVAWNHPNMPWDGTELKVASIGERGIEAPVTVAGGATQSVVDPQWDADGTLYFISDRSGYWNLYAWNGTGVRAVWARDADFATPQWSLGQTHYALSGDGRALVCFGEGGIQRLAVVDLRRGTGRVLASPYVEYAGFARLDVNQVAVIAGAAQAPSTIVSIDITQGTSRTLHESSAAPLAPERVSVAVPMEFVSAHERKAHAFYYGPLNPDFRAPPGTLPPLLTLVHGGPTGQASPAYSSRIQFWTSRGFAVVDVNYGGSSGFGRAYRQQLNGQWGVVDVEDVIAAARFLVTTGRADPAHTAISGGSAGGYTVLAALSSSDAFKAGADYYGVSDMTVLARDTHKFESRYLDTLIGPLPQAQSIYDSRSPLNHLDGFKAPLIVFQGEDDPVVPPNQSALIVEALRSRGIPLAYLLFPGEAHGFRKPETIVRSLECELSFYGQVFGFTPADTLPLLSIENLAPVTTGLVNCR
ncbi:MAG TPA: prolyl oligopeptidase family serine peptidase [Steroidobacteraceae bacterium]|jgi:dipeptidyl aminopeptidase/acylaminoacyl peptidase|nr:prolyl oligopeptidase family serine peptidase [Steroidobacteraceae bacterium]